jgi:hypothetical protein
MSDQIQKLTIQEVKEGLARGDFSTADLSGLIPKSSGDLSIGGGSNASQILPFIGSALVFLGLIFINSLYWETYDNWLKIGVTLITGCVVWFVSTLLANTKLHQSVSVSLHLIGSILVSGGILVTVLDIIKPNSHQNFLYLGLGFLFPACIQGIQTLFQKTWANTLSAYFYFLCSFWFLYGYFADVYNIQSTATMYAIFACTGASLYLASLAVRSTQIHISRLFQLGGGMFGYAAIYGVATEYKWFYGFVMALAIVAGLGYTIYKKLYIVLGVTLFWAYIYLQWLNWEYFKNQVGWGQSLIVIGVALIVIFQFLKSRKSKI